MSNMSDHQGHGRLVLLGVEPGQVVADVAGLLCRATDAGLPIVLAWATDGPGAYPAATFATGVEPAQRRRAAITRALDALGVTPVERVWLQLDPSRLGADEQLLTRAISLVVQPGDVVVVPDPTVDEAAAVCTRAVCAAVPLEQVVTRYSAPRPRSTSESWELAPDVLRRRAEALAHLDGSLLHDRSPDVEFYDADPLALLGVGDAVGAGAT